MNRGTPEQRLRDLPHYQTEHTIDLDTDKVLAEAKAMYKTVLASKDGTGPFIGFSEYYERQYPYLFERCPKWFKTIFENRMDSDAHFMNVLENMLNTVKNIQTKKMTNFDADKYIGTALHNKYILPNLDMSKEKQGLNGKRKRDD